MEKYWCDYCPEDFKTEKELKKHINEDHPITKTFDTTGDSDLSTIED